MITDAVGHRNPEHVNFKVDKSGFEEDTLIYFF